MFLLSTTPHGVDTAKREFSLPLPTYDHICQYYTNNVLHSLAPKYEQLGQLYADVPEFASKVTIAKIDATANDVPEDIQGFPTIKLYAAGSKGSPVDYDGSRTIEDLAKFVRDNGKHGVDAYVAEKVVEDGGDVTNSPAAASPSSTAADKESETSSSDDAEETAEAPRHEEL